MIHPSIGEIIQLAMISSIFDHFTIETPYPAIPAHTSPQIIECVADTGALKKVAILIQRAAPRRVAIMIAIKSLGSLISV